MASLATAGWCQTLGPGLLLNGSFEQLASTGKPVGWSDNGFAIDGTTARTGTNSFRLKNANLIPLSQSAWQDLGLKKGTYRLSGWVRTANLRGTGTGVRFCLLAPPAWPYTVANGCTRTVSGTNDWEYLAQDIVLNQDSSARVSLQAYGEPAGTAWFDDVQLQQLIPVPADTAPPIITAISAGGITGESATIAWTTNEPADSQVEYGPTTAYGSQTALDATKVTAHKVLLAGLVPATAYHFRIRSRDAAGNLALSADQTFTTLDTIPPVITGISVLGIGGSSATVCWTTDEPADTRVEYGISVAYGSATRLDLNRVITHSAVLTGLTSATLYHFRVESRDAAGNLGTSADQTFTTLDTTPPSITLVSAGSVTRDSATISWTTDEPADSQVEYGTTTAYGALTALNIALTTAHAVLLTGMHADTVYHSRVRSADGAGNLSISADFTFRTAADPTLKPGGLTAYPSGIIGPNLLGNPGFEQIAGTGKPALWSDNGFTLDSTVAHGGTMSFRITDSNTIPYSQRAWQNIPLQRGIYQLRGLVRTANLAAVQGSGVRLCLNSNAGGACTNLIKGTNDWTELKVAKIVLSSDTTGQFVLETYGEPDGTAWFDDLELHQEQIPLDVFLLYPNYRGMLFDDQSQVARFHFAVTPGNGTVLADYQVKASVTDEASGAIVLQDSFAASADGSAQFDFASLWPGGTYLVAFRLVRVGDGATVFDYPAYRISKIAGPIRTLTTVGVDAQNRVLLHGQPTFILGVYDSGLGYTTSESAWEDMLTAQRRLFELPVSLYLNYWYGGVGNDAMIPLLNVLQRHGIYALTNANCSGAGTVEQTAQYWFVQAPAADVQTRAANPGFAGFYAADECNSDIASNVFGYDQRMKALDPGGIVLGTLLGDPGLLLWRDTLDVLATDPYPLYGAEPAAGYPLSKVADWTQRARQAVQDARPVLAVLQFFQGTSNSRWPTQGELRNMSYMAIAEGANGLMYWSLGARALAYVCSGWCTQKIEYFESLKAVVNEIAALGVPLSSMDRPELLAGNSVAAAIHTRVKFADGKAYLIASNVTGAPVTAALTWSGPLTAISVYGEGRTITPALAGFSDSFGPYEAHVYVITPL